MCLFKWFKKKSQEPVEEPVKKPDVQEPQSEAKTDELPIPEPQVAVQPAAPQPEILVETPPEKTEPEPVIEPVTPAPAPAPEKIPEPVEPPVKEKVEPEKSENRYVGKYEVFPEAGFFKYRLKASNGEILIVSQGYSARTGATNGIDTLKRNIETGTFEIYTDKNDFSQFAIKGNAGRIIALGEFYESKKRCESAIESVKRFYPSDKIVQLDEIPASEIREEQIEMVPVEPNSNGKMEIVQKENLWVFILKASNSEVLFESSGYTTKTGCLSGLETIKKAIENANFRVSKDKQGRWQFKLYSTNNQLLLTGETYVDKDNCISAVASVRKFALNAKVTEL